MGKWQDFDKGASFEVPRKDNELMIYKNTFTYWKMADIG